VARVISFDERLAPLMVFHRVVLSVLWFHVADVDAPPFEFADFSSTIRRESGPPAEVAGAWSMYSSPPSLVLSQSVSWKMRSPD